VGEGGGGKLMYLGMNHNMGKEKKKEESKDKG